MAIIDPDIGKKTTIIDPDDVAKTTPPGVLESFGRGTLEGAENIPLRALQTAQKLEPGFLRALLPTGLAPLAQAGAGLLPQVQTVTDPRATGLSGAIGRGVGTGAGLLTTGLLAAPAELGALGSAATDALIGASQDPDSPLHGALFGAVGGQVLRGGGHLIKQIPKLGKYLFNPALVKHVEKVTEPIGKITDELYGTAYNGTDGITPVVDKSFTAALGDLNKPDIKAEVPLKVRKAINTYFQNPNTLRNLHSLRTDIARERRRVQFGAKAAKSGLNTPEKNAVTAMTNLEDSINNNLKFNFNTMSPAKVKEFETAQSHFFHNEVPLKNFSAVQQALSKNRKVTPAFRKAFLEDSKKAEELRKLVGISRTGLRVARPLAAAGVGLGAGALGAGGSIIRTLKDIL